MTKDQIDPAERQRGRSKSFTDYTQRLMRLSPKVRDEFWSKADRSSVENWNHSAEFYRNYVWEEMIGKLPAPRCHRSAYAASDRRTSLHGYEVVIDVYPDVIAGGILLLPKDLRPDEKRPVVVCQHGLEGVPHDTITRSGDGYRYYRRSPTNWPSEGSSFIRRKIPIAAEINSA